MKQHRPDVYRHLGFRLVAVGMKNLFPKSPQNMLELTRTIFTKWISNHLENVQRVRVPNHYEYIHLGLVTL